MFKRLFFGMEVKAPWPEELPEGRILDPEHRHLTLAFLGNTDFEKLEKMLETFPPPDFKVGAVGKFDQSLFLPPKHARVISWHVEWFEEISPLQKTYEKLISWLQEGGFAPDLHHDFTPHVTLARAPFNQSVWEKEFSSLPLYVKDIHLYESVGNLKYIPIWSYNVLAPFEEIDHTGELAFWVRGVTFDHLLRHALTALAFEFPPLLPYLSEQRDLSTLEEVIDALNHVIYHADMEIGIPFKAVSFHTGLETKDGVMHWEMIVDV